jgi:hypothetical protein
MHNVQANMQYTIVYWAYKILVEVGFSQRINEANDKLANISTE